MKYFISGWLPLKSKAPIVHLSPSVLKRKRTVCHSVAFVLDVIVVGHGGRLPCTDKVWLLDAVDSYLFLQFLCLIP